MAFNEQEAFMKEFAEILDYKSSEARSLFAYVKRILKQFNLHTRYEVSDILMEVFLRGISKTDTIQKPIPWIKAASLFVIRELSRSEGRQKNIAFKIRANSSDMNMSPVETLISLEIIEENLNKVSFAWEKLSSEEKTIFRWRLIQNRSWKSIQSMLAQRGENPQSVQSLRKRYSRTLSRLRKIFHSTFEDMV